MNSLKSGLVLMVMVGVLYGVYVVLSKPEQLERLHALRTAQTETREPEVAAPQIEFGVSSSPAPELALEAPAAAASPAVSPAVAESPAPVSTAPPLTTSSVYSQAPSEYAATASASSATTANVADATVPSAYNTGSAYDASANQRSSYETPASPPAANAPSSYQATPGGQAAVPRGSSAALGAYSVRQGLAQAEQLVAENKLKEALAVLTPYYTSPELSDEQREVIVQWLDPLAAKVIYSKQHVLDIPYESRGKETLFDIAERFQVPWQLLHNINSDVVSDPQLVVPGTKLKVVPGPLRAEVNLARGEITVFLNELYAGRFSIDLKSATPQPGTYKVVDKRRDRTYYGADGRTIPAGDPTNPYGGYWLDLGHEVSLHGSPQNDTGEPLGSISLSSQDAKDVYGILSLGSEVVIR